MILAGVSPLQTTTIFSDNGIYLHTVEYPEICCSTHLRRVNNSYAVVLVLPKLAESHMNPDTELTT